MLLPEGWLDGITASGVVIAGLALGIYCILKGRKLNTKLLLYLGLTTIFAGLMYLGVFLDFLIVLLTETNIPNANGEDALISYIWFAPLIVFAFYVGAQLTEPKAAKYIVPAFIVIGVIFEILIFIDPLGSFKFVDPPSPGVLLIDYNINLTSIAGIFMAFLLFPLIAVLGIGGFRRGVQATGEIRKRFFLLGIAMLIFGVTGIMEGFTEPGVLLIFVRIGYIGSFFLLYQGLK